MDDDFLLLSDFDSFDAKVHSLIDKSQKQALTHTRFDIDGGGTRDQLKSYQPSSHIWALQFAKNQKQFQRILLLIELYDWVYQFVSRFPEVSSWKLRFKANQWLRQRQKQIKRGIA